MTINAKYKREINVGEIGLKREKRASIPRLTKRFIIAINIKEARTISCGNLTLRIICEVLRIDLNPYSIPSLKKV